MPKTAFATLSKCWMPFRARNLKGFFDISTLYEKNLAPEKMSQGETNSLSSGFVAPVEFGEPHALSSSDIFDADTQLLAQFLCPLYRGQ